MEFEKTIDILKQADPAVIKRLVSKLNSDGIVSDEDDCLISSYIVERWSSECDSFLNQYGYTGSSLIVYGNFFQSHGAVYVLFNNEQHTHETAMQYMINHVNSYEY